MRCIAVNREFKIRRLRTTATDKYATAHDQNHVTVHFSRVVLRLRWVVELFGVVGTTENILLVFCHLGNSRISSFRKKSFQFTSFKWEGSEICKLCLISAQIYAFNPLLWLHLSLAVYTQNSDWRPRRREIIQVIYFLFALEKFQCFFELISESLYLCNLYLCEFLYRAICWMKMM